MLGSPRWENIGRFLKGKPNGNCLATTRSSSLPKSHRQSKHLPFKMMFGCLNVEAYLPQFAKEQEGIFFFSKTANNNGV